MTFALACIQPQPGELALAQAAWDQFFEDALGTFHDPNPDLCMDLALDKTLRALGPRPRPPLTPEEKEDLMIRMEVEQVMAASSVRPNYGNNFWGRE
jgi:hypothetical protein